MNRKERLQQLLKKNRERVNNMKKGVYPNGSLENELFWLSHDLNSIELIVKGM